MTLAGCSFSADYHGGLFQCSDGVCPTGFLCYQNLCIDADGGIPDAAIDAPPAALNCAEPGALTGQTIGDTTGRTSQVSAMCAGSVQNGADEVYELHAAMNQNMTIKITGQFQVDAYVLAPCEAAPAVPACLQDQVAIPNTPITVAAPTAGDYFIVVDSENASMMGPYALTVTLH